MLGLQKVKRLG